LDARRIRACGSVHALSSTLSMPPASQRVSGQRFRKARGISTRAAWGGHWPARAPGAGSPGPGRPGLPARWPPNATAAQTTPGGAGAPRAPPGRATPGTRPCLVASAPAPSGGAGGHPAVKPHPWGRRALALPQPPRPRRQACACPPRLARVARLPGRGQVIPGGIPPPARPTAEGVRQGAQAPPPGEPGHTAVGPSA
jgi:hypothetical protein